MNKSSFEENFYSGYTLIPNDLIRMRKNGEITRAEFEVLHLIFAFKNFNKHKTSASQMAILIGDIKPLTVCGVLKSLEEKKMIRSEKIDYHYTRYHLLLKEVTRVEITDESTFYFDSTKKEVVPLEAQPEQGKKEVMALETRHHSPRDTTVMALGPHIELRLKRNKKNIISTEKKPPSATTPSPEIILNLFNTMCNKSQSLIPSVRILSDSRKNTINTLSRKRLKTIAEWEEFFDKVFSSDFLKGDNKQQWHVTFDWVLKESNCVKILEGNYDSKSPIDKSAIAAKKIDDILEAKRIELRSQNINGAAT